MKITFLGTSSMVPTKERNHPSLLISYEAENIMIDCGENTQRQLKIADISPTKVTRLLITHIHGDHVLGIPGLIQTLSSSNYSKTLKIYGPPTIKQLIKNIITTFNLEDKIEIEVNEIKPGIFLKTENFQIEAISLKHSTTCYAYSFKEEDKRNINLAYTKKFGLTRHPLLGQLQKGKDIVYKNQKITVEKATKLRKGKKITVIYDTAFTENCIKIAKNSDILISEATFTEELKEKAKEYMHLTAKEAALIAKQAKVNKLILTHFSQRYKDSKEILKEAKKIFKNTIIANDFMTIKL